MLLLILLGLFKQYPLSFRSLPFLIFGGQPFGLCFSFLLQAFLLSLCFESSPLFFLLADSFLLFLSEHLLLFVSESLLLLLSESHHLLISLFLSFRLQAQPLFLSSNSGSLFLLQTQTFSFRLGFLP